MYGYRPQSNRPKHELKTAEALAEQEAARAEQEAARAEAAETEVAQLREQLQHLQTRG